MTTWLHYPYSHPWMPTLKRKLEYSDDDSERDSPSPPSSQQQFSPRTHHHLPKRRRYDLSRNLSRLSLLERVYHPYTPIIEEPQQEPSEQLSTTNSSTSTQGWDVQEMPVSMDADVERPVIEEPIESEKPVPEVRMRGSSSYEPEKDRIVITDLDSSESESEQDDSHDSLTLSSAAAAQLNTAKRISLFNSIPMSQQPDASKAVVLYKPSPWATSHSQKPNGMNNIRDQGFTIDLPRDEDGMDIE